MKRLVEGIDSIDIRDVAKVLTDNTKSGRVELKISNVSIQEIDVVSTPVQFGFVCWFVCPGCSRRAKKLYLPPGEKAFLCRHCYDLSYKTQQLREYRKTKYHRKKKKETSLEERIKKRLKILRKLEELLNSLDRGNYSR